MLCWPLPLKDGTCNSNELGYTSRRAETLSLRQRSEDGPSESICLQACAIYCAAHPWSAVNRLPSCSGFDLGVADLKKPDPQSIEVPTFFFFFEWQPHYLVGDHSFTLSFRPWSLLLKWIRIFLHFDLQSPRLWFNLDSAWGSQHMMSGVNKYC